MIYVHNMPLAGGLVFLTVLWGRVVLSTADQTSFAWMAHLGLTHPRDQSDTSHEGEQDFLCIYTIVYIHHVVITSYVLILKTNMIVLNGFCHSFLTVSCLDVLDHNIHKALLR